jgi:apolipoprotein N-acyltransferase
VWPEAAITGFVQKELGLYRAISNLARQTHAFLLVGGAGRPKFGSAEVRESTVYNSVFLVNPQGRIKQRYDKIRLMPFGEFVPYRNLLPWPDYYLKGTEDYARGTEYTLFEAGGLRFAAVICWEMYFPDIAREFTRRGAELLVNITNEAWFGDSDASRQFLALSVFRAVENAVYVARAANTGISAFIDPYGRILTKVEQNGKAVEVAGYAVADIQRRTETTVYTRLGDVFALANLALCVSVVFVTSLRRRSSPTPVRRAA